MKYLLVIIILLSVAFPVSAFTFRVKTFNDLTGYCPSGSKALGCIYNTGMIYLDNDIPPIYFQHYLVHEIGHWFLKDLTYKDYQRYFGNGSLYTLQERGANRFSYYVRNGIYYSPAEKQLFDDLLKIQNINFIY